MSSSPSSELPAPTETGFAGIADHAIEFERYGGDASLPTIVLLHEGLGSVAMWRDFPAHLASVIGTGVIAYSRRGYGASSPRAAAYEPDYMHREARETLPALLDYWGLDRPVLVGHSDGASIALIYGAEPQCRAAGIAALAPHIFVEDISIESISAAKEAFATSDLADRLGRYHADVQHAFRGWNDGWLDPAFRDWNLEALLPDIRCPVLAIQGEDDPYGTMAQIDGIERGITAPFARLDLPGCGHSPHREKPMETLAALAAFHRRIAEGAYAA